jgi:hypothetical protein
VNIVRFWFTRRWVVFNCFDFAVFIALMVGAMLFGDVVMAWSLLGKITFSTVCVALWSISSFAGEMILESWAGEV